MVFPVKTRASRRRTGTRAEKKHALGAGKDGREPLRQLDLRLGKRGGKDRPALADLLDDSVIYLPSPVPEEDRAAGGGKIDVALAVPIPHVCALTAIDHKRKGAFEIGAQ